MKELLLQYAEYNVWANKRIIDVILPLDEAVLNKEMVSSFPSVRATTYHIMGAEFIWLQRLQLVEKTIWLPDAFEGTFAEGCRVWEDASAGLVQYVAQSTNDAALSSICDYRDRANRTHRTPVCQILHHVFNHSTYHRGQLVTMLRQLGITNIPGTDIIGFVKQM